MAFMILGDECRDSRPIRCEVSAFPVFLARFIRAQAAEDGTSGFVKTTGISTRRNEFGGCFNMAVSRQYGVLPGQFRRPERSRDDDSPRHDGAASPAPHMPAL